MPNIKPKIVYEILNEFPLMWFDPSNEFIESAGLAAVDSACHNTSGQLFVSYNHAFDYGAEMASKDIIIYVMLAANNWLYMERLGLVHADDVLSTARNQFFKTIKRLATNEFDTNVKELQSQLSVIKDYITVTDITFIDATSPNMLSNELISLTVQSHRVHQKKRELDDNFEYFSNDIVEKLRSSDRILRMFR